jgi:hypothetical protein
VLLHQFGEDLMLAAEFVLQGCDGAILDVGNGLAAFVVGGEGGGAVLEERFLPVVEVGDGDAVLLAQIRDGDFLQEMGPENRDLLLRGEVATLPAHEKSSARVLPLTPTKASSRSDWGDTIRNIHGVAPVAELDGDEIGYLVSKVAEIKRQAR